MKSIINILIKPSTIIINQMLETGVFQDNLKIAKVIPLYKLTNYRPELILFSHLFQRYLKKLYTNN